MGLTVTERTAWAEAFLATYRTMERGGGSPESCLMAASAAANEARDEFLKEKQAAERSAKRPAVSSRR